MDAFADRGQQDHRRDAHGDAEQRQKAAQPVCGDRAQRQLQGIARADHSASIALLILRSHGVFRSVARWIDMHGNDAPDWPKR